MKYLILILFLVGCSAGSSSDTEPDCAQGSPSCECYDDRSCDNGVSCDDNFTCDPTLVDLPITQTPNTSTASGGSSNVMESTGGTSASTGGSSNGDVVGDTCIEDLGECLGNAATTTTECLQAIVAGDNQCTNQVDWWACQSPYGRAIIDCQDRYPECIGELDFVSRCEVLCDPLACWQATESNCIIEEVQNCNNVQTECTTACR